MIVQYGCRGEGGGLTGRSHEMSSSWLGGPGTAGTATLQGTEENSGVGSRVSPSSTRREGETEEPSLEGSDRQRDACSELETIFEKSSSEAASGSNDGQQTGTGQHNHENPLFFSLVAGAADTSSGPAWLDQQQQAGPARRTGPFFSSPPSPLRQHTAILKSCRKY